MGGQLSDVPGGTALALPATRSALRRHFRRSGMLFVAGLVMMFSGFALADALGYDGEGDSAGEMLTFAWTLLGFAGIVVSVLCFGTHIRKWQHLRRAPWRVWQCSSAEVQPGRMLRLGAGLGGQVPNPYRVLVLGDDADVDPPILLITGNQLRARALDKCDDGEIWLAGDPRRSCVISLPGGAKLFGARRPLRESLRRRMLDEIRSVASDAR